LPSSLSHVNGHPLYNWDWYEIHAPHEADEDVAADGHVEFTELREMGGALSEEGSDASPARGRRYDGNTFFF
jgi:hypothetical protein